MAVLPLRVSCRALLVAVSLASGGVAVPRHVLASTTLLAVADPGFADSSGEPGNQQAAHRERLKTVAETLRQALARAVPAEVVALSCPADGCEVDQPGVAALRERARQKGAALVLVCGVHKMSTLILSMRVGVLDVATGRLIAERWLSFRGDTDEGWRRAAEYVAADIAPAIAAAR
ncbi:DUF3280 domain-containing protein [Ancylobacter sp. 6x-1]|uniref:DUF3280 domain-containing protein n=1 Tax=Ancylobacter crimeensis TaxID=2579147 RepID=A0ABT0DA27_9HYPH|nr:DUF2380 domain-containing protein [Ancylobacter crimeensis]MCK0196764.1 DUF3280 domain-containing protein [Ancylobacter crimeensis]